MEKKRTSEYENERNKFALGETNSKVLLHVFLNRLVKNRLQDAVLPHVLHEKIK